MIFESSFVTSEGKKKKQKSLKPKRDKKGKLRSLKVLALMFLLVVFDILRAALVLYIEGL